MTAENMDTRSRAMRLLTVDQLCVLLRHALARMRTVTSIEPFLKSVDPILFPAYKDYVFCPMDLNTIEKNIKKKQYGSTEACLADIKWILHNCIIFNSLASKLTSVAKSLVKICKHEMQEIENCPDCYLNAHTKKDSWFVAACRIPHPLVWAKLKGFPFWPAKAMRINSEENVDVRFFGAHDRAWIPTKDVYLYSLEAPVVLKNKAKRGNLDGCIHEVDMFIKNIKDKFGKFQHAPSKVNLDPRKEEEQLKMLYPNCNLPFDLGPRRRARTYSFSGSERSHTATPTPSEVEGAMTEDESQTATEPANDLSHTEVEEDLEQPSIMPEKPDLEDDMLTIEDDEVEFPKVAKVSEVPATKNSSNHDIQTTKPAVAETIAKDSSKEPVKAVSEAITKVTSDRAAASPPCEVSSTTINNEIEKEKGNKDKSQGTSSTETENNQAKAKNITTEVIAETSETVEIEGADPTQDEEEIDDDEDAAEMENNTDNTSAPKKSNEEVTSKADKTEPATSAVQKNSESPENKNQDDLVTVEPEAEKMDTSEVVTDKVAEIASNTTERVMVSEKDKGKPTESAEKLRSDQKASAAVASSEEEIDDEEPELVIEESADDIEAEENVERLTASGISVTVIEKNKQSQPHQQKPKQQQHQKSIVDPEKDLKIASDTAKTNKESMGLSSDISVTVVHKKKIDVGGTSSSGPKISVKKESELLESSKKDIVDVTRKTVRKPSIELEASMTGSNSNNKLPPDPIVTISKVQNNAGAIPGLSSAVGAGTSLLKNSNAPKSSSPALARSSALSSSTVANSSSVASTLNSLASILGQPRMSTAPPSNQPRFAGGRPPPNNIPRNSSPLMMASGPYRPPNSGSPMGPMPNLHPRPLLGGPPSGTPAVTGPVSEQLNKVAGKLVDFMRGTLEELFRELSTQGSPEATIKALQIEMEKMQWRQQQELAEVKHNADLLMMELRQTVEAEKQKVLGDFKKQAEIEKHKAIAETKKKQWCAHCGKEAIFYCCWNTSYCDYPCQQAHWPSHMSTCAQNQANQDEDGNGNDNDHGPPGATSGPGAGHEAVQHFLANSQAGANGPGVASSRSNGLGPQAARGIQVRQGNPMMMPGGPHQFGLSPRMMNQLNAQMTMAAAAAAAGQPPPGLGPRGALAGRMRFPGQYFM
jgi:hypothetical protein